MTKDATAEEIEHAIRALLAAGAAVQQRLVIAVLDQTRPTPAGEPAPASRSDLPDELTPREVEVLKLVAAQLFLSNATVKTHINRIFYKTGATALKPTATPTNTASHKPQRAHELAKPGAFGAQTPARAQGTSVSHAR